MKRVLYRDLGRMGYSECWALQRSEFEAMLACKREAQTQDNAGQLLLVEHNPVYTLGKSGKEQNMLVSEEYLRSIGAEFFHIDRGGDITYHGPGQIVGYPILDLEQIGIGLREYIDSIEESIIDVCAEWGIRAGRIAGASGVWLEPESPRARKICAIGDGRYGYQFNRSPPWQPTDAQRCRTYRQGVADTRYIPRGRMR